MRMARYQARKENPATKAGPRRGDAQTARDCDRGRAPRQGDCYGVVTKASSEPRADPPVGFTDTEGEGHVRETQPTIPQRESLA